MRKKQKESWGMAGEDRIVGDDVGDVDGGQIVRDSVSMEGRARGVLYASPSWPQT